jgi:LPS-assembly protein
VDNRFYKSMRDRLSPVVRLRILSIAVLAVTADGAAAQASSPAASAPASASSAPGIELRNSTSLASPPRGDAGKHLPIILQAREMKGRPDLDAEAVGDVEFRRGAVVIRSDRLTYDQAEDLARATGNVVVSREGNVFFGPELQLRVERFEGFFAARPTASSAPTPAARRR